MKSVLLTTPEVITLARDGSVEVRRAVKRTSDQFWEHPGWTPTIEGPNIVWRSPDVPTIYTFPLRSPFGSPGGERWVRETHNPSAVYYRAIEFGGGKYFVGTDGHVYRLRDGQMIRRPASLTPKGYEDLRLRHNGEQRSFRVNRLVAEAFYGPAAPGEVCRHIDGDKRNNRPENLDWGTPAQNSADAVAMGAFSGARASKARLTEEQVRSIRSSTETDSTLACRFGVTQPTISKIRTGARWKERVPDAPPRNHPAWRPWRSAANCPAWASRYTVTCSALRVEKNNNVWEWVATLTRKGEG